MRDPATVERERMDALIAEIGDLAERLAEAHRTGDAATLRADVARAAAIVESAEGHADAGLAVQLAAERTAEPLPIERALGEAQDDARRALADAWRDLGWLDAAAAPAAAAEGQRAIALAQRRLADADAALADEQWAERPVLQLCEALAEPGRVRDAAERAEREIADREIAGPLARAMHALDRAAREPTRDGGSLAEAVLGSAAVPVELARATVRHPHRLAARAAHEPAPLDGDTWEIPLKVWPLQHVEHQPYLLPPGQSSAAGPLAIADAAGVPSSEQGTAGAPLALRVFVEFMAGVVGRELPMGVHASLRFSLRDLVEALWPREPGARTWTRQRDLPRLARALDLVHLAGIPYVQPSGRLAMWRPLAVRTPPLLDAQLDDPFVVDVHLPPDGKFGPRVHMPTLRALGLDSGPAYRAYLALAWHWYEGREPSGWRAEPSALDAAERERWPTLGPQEIAALAYPADAFVGGPRSRLAVERGRDVIAQLATPGDVLPLGMGGGPAREAGASALGLLRVEDAGHGRVRLLPANAARALPRLLRPEGETWDQRA